MVFLGRGVAHAGIAFSYIEAHPVLSPIVFILLYSVCIFFVVPSLPFNLAAGFLWGPLLGSVIALGGSVFGSMCAFLFARTALGQPLAEQYDNALISWMQQKLEEMGWGVIGFMCVNPAIPLGPQNFVFGLTSMKFSTFTWATTLFLYPPVLAICYLGNATGQLALVGDYKRAFELVLMASAAVTALVVIRIVMKRFFAKNGDGGPPQDMGADK